MDALIGDRFLKRFLKGSRPGSQTGSTASAAPQDSEDSQEPTRDDETCEDLTRESRYEPQAPGKERPIGPLPELSRGIGVDGGK